MKTVEWSDGLSTGVEAIDKDHKKLISLINQISAAIESQQTNQVIGNVFDQLEDYIEQHFAREEELLRHCQYDDLASHIESHRTFSNKIPELKQQLLTSSSRQVAEEVCQFLINWMINHIVAEDQLYTPALNEHGLTISPLHKAQSPLNRSARWLSRYVALNRRILLTALLPTLGILLLSLMIIWGSVRQLNELKTLEGLFYLASPSGELIHSLQAERGLSTGMISSNYQSFSADLAAQRMLTNKAIGALNQQLSSLPSEISQGKLNDHITQINQHLDQLSEHRRRIDSQSISISEMKGAYTDIITHLLSLPNGIVQHPMDSTLSNRVISFSAIMHLKEAVGLERALGTKAIEQGELTGSNLLEFTLLLGEQHSFLRMFKQTANPAATQQWQQLDNSDVADAVKTIEASFFTAIDKGILSSVDSYRWFDQLTMKMDMLKMLSDQLVQDLENHATQKTANLYMKLYSTVALLLFLMLLTLLLSKVLTRSITLPISQLTRAITYLSTGNRNIRLEDKLANDELRQMTAAYELCRLGLLQGDLEDLELQYKIRESKYYKGLASTDSLTGAYNRREFQIWANAELDRSRRYDSPLSILIVDLDHFKNINDTYGHTSGDQVLRSFAQMCKSQLRCSDIMARIGGEEFVILLPETDQSQAFMLAERIRKTIKTMKVSFKDQEVYVTVSIGIAQWDNAAFKELDELFDQADDALYAAKENGRDLVWPDPDHHTRKVIQ